MPTSLSEERRNHIAAALSAYFLSKGTNKKDVALQMFTDTPQRLAEISESIDVPQQDLTQFCWWMVEAALEATLDTGR